MLLDSLPLQGCLHHKPRQRRRRLRMQIAGSMASVRVIRQPLSVNPLSVRLRASCTSIASAHATASFTTRRRRKNSQQTIQPTSRKKSPILHFRLMTPRLGRIASPGTPSHSKDLCRRLASARSGLVELFMVGHIEWDIHFLSCRAGFPVPD